MVTKFETFVSSKNNQSTKPKEEEEKSTNSTNFEKFTGTEQKQSILPKTPSKSSSRSSDVKREQVGQLNQFSDKSLLGTSQSSGFEVSQTGVVTKITAPGPTVTRVVQAQETGQKEVILKPFFTKEGQKQRLTNVVRTFQALNPVDKKEIKVTDAAPKIFQNNVVKGATEFVANNPFETAFYATGLGAIGRSTVLGTKATITGLRAGAGAVSKVAAKEGLKAAAKFATTEGAKTTGRMALLVGQQAVKQTALGVGIKVGTDVGEKITRSKESKTLLSRDDLNIKLNEAIRNANIDLEIEVGKLKENPSILDKFKVGAKQIALGISPNIADRFTSETRKKSLEQSAKELGLFGRDKDIFVEAGLRKMNFSGVGEFSYNVLNEAVSNRYGYKQKENIYNFLGGTQRQAGKFTKVSALTGFASTAPVAAVEGVTQSIFQDVFRGTASFKDQTIARGDKTITKESTLKSAQTGALFGFGIGGAFGAVLDSSAFKTVKGTKLVSTPKTQKTVLGVGYLLDVPFEFLGDKVDDASRAINKAITGKAPKEIGIGLTTRKGQDFFELIGSKAPKSKVFTVSPTTGLIQSQTKSTTQSQSQKPTKTFSFSQFWSLSNIPTKGQTPTTEPSTSRKPQSPKPNPYASFLFGSETPTDGETPSDTPVDTVTETTTTTPTQTLFPSFTTTPTIRGAVPFFAPPLLPFGQQQGRGSRDKAKIYKREIEASKTLFGSLVGNPFQRPTTKKKK